LKRNAVGVEIAAREILVFDAFDSFAPDMRNEFSRINPQAFADWREITHRSVLDDALDAAHTTKAVWQ